jgi:RNA recognition motif-containing protein
MDAKLYVGNLPYLTTDDELRTLFARAGTVASAAVIKDRDTGTSKGFGFVAMSTRAEAENAIKLLDNHPLGEHTLKVNLARPRIARSSGYRR